MQKGMNFFGALILIFLGSALWPLIGANSSSGLREEPYAKEGAAMMDTQSDGNKTNRQGRKKSGQESPFACNMLALDAEGRRRHKVVAEQMRAAVKEVQPLQDGYAFRFQAEQSTILLASEFIARERLCCPFFTFELVAEQEDGPLWLRLRGREGVKAFIKSEFGIK